MIRVADEVREALAGGGAVVALETTLVAHGFPPGEGVEVGLESERQVRAAGAVPATVGVLDGEVRVGLTEDELARFEPD
ncbi:MAG TPA: pseudouridine-5'-phosphate glycosidase, partial [Gaiellaceae bacterium]|nr:pseudouridine-5'-phosphate glycosidase [Gaiellaceae bacterium]